MRIYDFFRHVCFVGVCGFLIGCTNISSPASYTVSEIHGLSQDETLLAFKTDYSIYFENFDPAADRVPQRCWSYRAWISTPVEPPEKSNADKTLIVISVAPGTYIFSSEHPWLFNPKFSHSDTSFINEASFSIRRGQRLFLGNFVHGMKRPFQNGLPIAVPSELAKEHFIPVARLNPANMDESRPPLCNASF